MSSDKTKLELSNGVTMAQFHLYSRAFEGFPQHGLYFHILMDVNCYAIIVSELFIYFILVVYVNLKYDIEDPHESYFQVNRTSSLNICFIIIIIKFVSFLVDLIYLMQGNCSQKKPIGPYLLLLTPSGQ